METTTMNNPEHRQSVLREIKAMLGDVPEPLSVEEEIKRTIARISEKMDRVRQEAKENDQHA